MINWIEKTPDFLIGTVVAGTMWFGFNYVVLAERAMGDSIKNEIVPQCMEALNRAESGTILLNLPPELIPDMPGFDLKRMLRGLQSGMRLSDYKRRAICVCGAKSTGRALKFDYAIHTASFRLIEPASVSNLRGKTMNVVRTQTCGALPWMNIGR